jgi:hypothetical protein
MCHFSGVSVVSLGQLAKFMPTDTGTMNKDNTTSTVRPDAGVATLLFGLSPSNDAVVRLDLGGQVYQADCRSISAAQLAQVTRIVCCLFPTQGDRQNDAVSVIEALCQQEYRGEIWVLAPPLLRPKMVESELRGLAKGLALRLLAGHLPPLTEI